MGWGMRGHCVWIGPVVALGLLWAGMTGAALAAEPVALRRDNGAEPATLDPHKFSATTEDNLITDLFEGLTATRIDGALVPGQAESWEASPDGLTWTFHLRADLHWSNGDPLTADDFVWSLQRIVDPNTTSYVSFLLDSVVAAKDITSGVEKDPGKLGVRAVDPRTLEMHLIHPNPVLPEMLTEIRPVHRGSIEIHKDQAFKPGHIVSNGAYRLVAWRPQSEIIAERNPAYWDAAHVQIERVTYLPIENENEALKAYRSGGIDITASVPNDLIPFILERYPSEYKVSPMLGLYYLGINLERPPFKDNPMLRKALSLAIDRDQLVAKIAGNGTIAAKTIVPPHFNFYPAPPEATRTLTTDEREAAAKAAYRAAGYGPGHPLTLELMYNTSENHKRVMIAVASMWKKTLGVETSLINQEFKVFLDNRREKKITQIYRAGFIGFYNDAAPLLEIFRARSTYNDFGYDNPAFDRLYEAAMASVDNGARLQGLAAAEHVLLDDLPALPLYFYAVRHMIKPYIQGWAPSPRDNLRTQDLTILPH